MQWFRYHAASLHKQKVQALSGDLFKFWVNLLCVAAEADNPGGALPPARDIAWTLRMAEGSVDAFIAELVNRGLLECDDGTYYPHDWDKHQYKTSTERTRKWRSKNVTSDEPEHFGDIPIIVSETMPPNTAAFVSGDGKELTMVRFSDVPGDVPATDQNRTETEQRHTPPPAEVARDFNALLRAYPAARRINIPDAKREWMNAWNAGEVPTVLDILRALNTHKDSSEWTKDGGQFIPGIDKYIAARMWEAPPINKDPEKKRLLTQAEMNAPAPGRFVQ